MEKEKGILMLLLTLLFVSCSSEGDGSASYDNPVSVCLSVETPVSDPEQSVSSGDNVKNLSYFYTAVPQWSKRDFDTVPGAVSTMHEFKNGDSLGDFQPGYWLFSVEVRNAVEGEISVVYTGSAYTYINSDTTSVTVNVSAAEGTGTVDITVYVPTAAENESMEISYSGAADAQGVTAEAMKITEPGTYQHYTMFSKVITDLPAGGYTFILDYNDGTAQSSLSGGSIGGATVDVNVAPGATSVITGTVEGGMLRAVTPSVIMPGLSSFTMTQDGSIPAGSMWSPGAVSASADTDTLFSVSSIPKGSAVVNSYEWYLNSAALESDGISCTLNVPAGTYVLTCVATGSAGNRLFTASVKSIVHVQ